MNTLLDAFNRVMRTILFLPEQASTIARPVDELQYFEILTTAGIATVLMALGFWFLWRYRRRAPGNRTPRVEASVPTELAMGGGVLALFLVWWFLSFRQYVYESVPPDNATDVYVTAKQWMWKFAYADGPPSAGILYVPAGRPVRLLITSRDVIHSFFVPDFRIKRDAVPGRYNTIWFAAPEPGVHRILCAEMCGGGHSRMRAAVVVLGPADYARWRRGEPPNVDLSRLDISITPEPSSQEVETGDLRGRGQSIAAREGCLGCHAVDPTAPAQAFAGPSWVGLFGAVQPMQDGTRLVADPAYLTQSIMDPAAHIVAGYPNVMPSYQGRIAPAEVAAILEYMRSLRTGPLPPQPTQKEGP